MHLRTHFEGEVPDTIRDVWSWRHVKGFVIFLKINDHEDLEKHCFIEKFKRLKHNS